MFLGGLYFFIGVTGLIGFFSRKGILKLISGKIKGSIVYFSGFILIIIGIVFIGAIVEIIGFLIIFRQFLPDFYDYVCKTPLIGRYLSNLYLKIESYYVQNMLDSFAGNQKNRI